MYISLKMLQAHGACRKMQRRFERVFGRGVRVTPALVERERVLGRFWLWWFVIDNLLPMRAYRAFYHRPQPFSWGPQLLSWDWMAKYVKRHQHGPCPLLRKPIAGQDRTL